MLAIASGILAGLALPTASALQVLALVLPGVGLLMMVLSIVFLPFALAGVLMGFRALQAIWKRPDQLRGIGLAVFGILTVPLLTMNLFVLHLMPGLVGIAFPPGLTGWLLGLATAVTTVVVLDVRVTRRMLAWARGTPLDSGGSFRLRHAGLVFLLVICFGFASSWQQQQQKPLAPWLIEEAKQHSKEPLGAPSKGDENK